MNDYKNTALLVIDVQVGLDEIMKSGRNNLQAESNIASLLKVWRDSGKQVIHVKHNSLEPDSPLRAELPGNEFKPECQPLETENVFEKSVNSAFIGTELEAYLKNQGITELLVVGLTTDHCVSTSTRMASNLGFDVTLVQDGTATSGRTDGDGTVFTAEQIHAVNVLSLSGEFCKVVNTEEVLSAVAG